MVSIRCAHRDIALYPLAEVNMEVEVHCNYFVWKVADYRSIGVLVIQLLVMSKKFDG